MAEMGAWQDRNGSLAGQKWEAWQKIICKTQHFESFCVISVYFLPLLVGFCHTFLFFSCFCLFFSRFCLFFSHLSSNLSISSTVWQDSLAEKLGTAAWSNTWPPWKEEISAGRKVATMVGFWEKSQKSDQMPYFGQNLMGFLSLQRNLEEFSRNSEIYQHDNV